MSEKPHTAATDYLSRAQSFVDGQGGNFATLCCEGMNLANIDYRALADKVECIPSTVLRWKSGEGKPMPGVQRFVIRYLRERVEKLISTCAECRKQIVGKPRIVDVFGPVYVCSAICEMAICDSLDGAPSSEIDEWSNQMRLEIGSDRYYQECANRGVQPDGDWRPRWLFRLWKMFR